MGFGVHSWHSGIGEFLNLLLFIGIPLILGILIYRPINAWIKERRKKNSH